MAALPDFARLLAIGLLNYADDLGFFWANSLMIRGSLFPFEEDSSKVRKGLAQLASEGYIRLGKTNDGREVGQVVNFSKHQRVDKPQESEIKPLAIFEERSGNGLLPFDEQSSLYGIGKEGIGKEGNGSIERPADPDLAVKIYEAYPRRVGKQDAIKAIKKTLESRPALAATLLATVEAYAGATALWPSGDQQFIPHPATWFNRGSYDDDPETWVRRAPDRAPGVLGKRSSMAD